MLSPVPMILLSAEQMVVDVVSAKLFSVVMSVALSSHQSLISHNMRSSSTTSDRHSSQPLAASCPCLACYQPIQQPKTNFHPLVRFSDVCEIPRRDRSSEAKSDPEGRFFRVPHRLPIYG